MQNFHLLAQIQTQVQNLTQNQQVQNVTQGAQHAYFSWLPLLKTLSVFATAFFVVSTVYFAIKTGYLAVRIDRVEDILLKKNLPKRRTVKGWRKVQLNFFQGDDSHLKIAIIEADKLLNDALKAAGFKGEDLGDRLKKLTTTQLPNLDDIWEAHRLRNRIAHENDFRLSRHDAERALAIYQQTLNYLGILD